MQLATTATQQRDGSMAGWLAPLALFAAACLLYSINLGRMAHPDEFHHILAAQGLLATGEPRIAEGVYTRVYLQTWLVAKSFSLFGDSLAAARVPSLIATALLVATLFAWLRREAGRAGGMDRRRPLRHLAFRGRHGAVLPLLRHAEPGDVRHRDGRLRGRQGPERSPVASAGPARCSPWPR